MSAITEAFDAAAREFLKETWKKDLPSRWRHPLTGVRIAEREYPASLTHFVEAEIDGVPMTFAFRIRPVK